MPSPDRRRRPGLLGAGLGLLGLGAGLVGARRVDELRDERSRRRAATPSDHGLAATDLLLRSSVGSLLHAWWVPAGTGPAPVAVVVHGFASHAGDLLPLAPVLRDAGFHVLLLDLRGHGRSEPVSDRPRPPTLAEDVAVALDHVAAREDVRGITLVGHSMGGTVALLAAAADDRVAGVVSVAGVADPTLSRIGFWPAWVSRLLLRRVAARQDHDPTATFARERIREVAAPVLLLHGGRDRVVPAVHSRVLAEAGRDTRLVLLPEAGHASFDAFLPALDDAVRFLRDAVQPRAT